jgi:hypothetical protein
MFEPVVEKLVLNIEQIFTKNSFKSKLKIIQEFGHALGIVEKPSVSRIGVFEGVLEMQLVFEKMVLKGKFTWVTNSHLDQLHMIH